MRSLIFLIVAALSVLYAEAQYGGGGDGNNWGSSQGSSAYGSSQGSSAYGSSQGSSAYGSSQGSSAHGRSGSSSYGNNAYGSSGTRRMHHHGQGHSSAMIAAAKKCHRLRMKKMSSVSLTDAEEATLTGEQCAKLLPILDYHICIGIGKKLQSGQQLGGLELQLKPKCREIMTKVRSRYGHGHGHGHEHGHGHGHGHGDEHRRASYTTEKLKSCFKLYDKSKQRIPFTEEEKQSISFCKKVFAEHARQAAVVCKSIARARAQGKQIYEKYLNLERQCPRILASQRRRDGGTNNGQQGAYGSSRYNSNSAGYGGRASSDYKSNSGYGGHSAPKQDNYGQSAGQSAYGHKPRRSWKLNPRMKSQTQVCSAGYKMNTTEKMKSNAKYSKCMVKTKITTSEACASACLKCSHCNTATFISQANICIACKVYNLPGKQVGPELTPCPICTVYQKTCKAAKNPFLKSETVK